MIEVIKFLELMWLMIAIICLIVGTYHLIHSTIDDALFFYIFGLLATLLYFIRKRQRKKIQQNQK